MNGPVPLALVSGGLLLVLLLVVGMRSRGRRRRPHAAGTEALDELRAFSRELEARLDGRIEELRELVALAETAAARLESLFSSARPARGSEREEVAALYREGMRPEAIASVLGLPRGEVELIVSLEEVAERARRAPRSAGFPPPPA